MEDRLKKYLVRFKKGDVIASQSDWVKNWYFIENGTVIQKLGQLTITLSEKNVIGVSDGDTYLSEYVAATDVEAVAIRLPLDESMTAMFDGQMATRMTALEAAMRQKEMLLKIYQKYSVSVKSFHNCVESFYDEYQKSCNMLSVKPRELKDIEAFGGLELKHRTEKWEIAYSDNLMNYMQPYITLMKQYDALTLGAIMEMTYQCKRAVQGISEMADYLFYNKTLLLSEDNDDLFWLYQDLIVKAEDKGKNVAAITTKVDILIDTMKKLGVYDSKLIEERVEGYRNRSLAAMLEKDQEMAENANFTEQILDYADITKAEKSEILSDLNEYHSQKDLASTTDEARALRKKVTNDFYLLYDKVFLKSLNDTNLPIGVVLFLNFGYLDTQLVDEETTAALVSLARHLDACKSKNVYTAYRWLVSIYKGENEPSKSELDLDYTAYIIEMKKNGEITSDQVNARMQDQMAKVKYELTNFFRSANRSTYGKISTYCPVMNGAEFMNAPDKMLLTTSKLEASLDAIRKIDFSVFYREVTFSDPAHDINAEMIQKEVLPNIILLPNIGQRAMMWQEIAGTKRDTPARFVFSIFEAADLDDLMIETVGRYRWEMCRRIQGVHWNDIRDKSLTAEFCDYLQYYRKNHDLTTEGKEKVKSQLQRCRNNFREVFAKDYVTWIKFESKGSIRLNKVSRAVLLEYCPFTKAIRDDLKENPTYGEGIHRLEVKYGKVLKRINGVYKKYTDAGGEITQELQVNLDFYEL